MYDTWLNQIRESGLYREMISRVPLDATTIEVGGKKAVSFSSNDYLGLSMHPQLIQAGQTALARYGAGSGGSRLLSGTFPAHLEFEQALAGFLESESALLFGSGYAANLALLSTLATRGDLILSDRLNHASIMDGGRLSRATFRIYRHRDADHLRTLLKKRKSVKRTWIVTEGVFSMEGDLAPLPEIVSLAAEQDAGLIVDDAHGFGVLGHFGRGIGEHFNIRQDHWIYMGTLGKAAGLVGAFVAGPRSLTDYLVNRAKPFIYSTALPPLIPETGIASLALIRSSVEPRERLRKNYLYFASRLRDFGFPVAEASSPIIPVLIGDHRKASDLSRLLMDGGFYVPAIRPPTVPDGSSRLRFSLSSEHRRNQLDDCLQALVRSGRQIGIL